MESRQRWLLWIGTGLVLVLFGLVLFVMIGRVPSVQTYVDRFTDADAKGDIDGAIAILITSASKILTNQLQQQTVLMDAGNNS
jgi:hypothetical protein